MRTAFLFAGQGAQYIGMGKDLYDYHEEAKQIFISADRILGFSLSELCFQGSKEELDRTENTQPAVLTTSIAALRALESAGIKADAVAGLSLGEYAALISVGSLQFEEAVNLVRKRGRFMQEAVPEGVGGMAAVLGLDAELIEEACRSTEGFVEVANYNCPGQIVIAGEKDPLQAAGQKAKELGAKRVLPLDVSGPFHTSLLKPAADQLEQELDKITFMDLTIPVISNVTGDYIENTSQVKDLLKRQVMSPVRWEDTIRRLLADGFDTFVEIGPGSALRGCVKKIDRKVKLLNVEDVSSLNSTIEYLR